MPPGGELSGRSVIGLFSLAPQDASVARISEAKPTSPFIVNSSRVPRSSPSKEGATNTTQAPSRGGAIESGIVRAMSREDDSSLRRARHLLGPTRDAPMSKELLEPEEALAGVVVIFADGRPARRIFPVGQIGRASC